MVPGIEFGEKIMFKKSLGQRGVQALSSLWSVGFFLGVRPVSGEYMVGDCQGAVLRVRTLRRRPEEVRWIGEGRPEVRAVPWNGGQGDPDADGLMPEEEVERRLGEGDRGRDPIPVIPKYERPMASEPVPRAFSNQEARLGQARLRK